MAGTISTAYSFQDITAAITGEGGNFSLKVGAADEGITVEAVQDKNVMTTGADGFVMHSLVSTSASTITVRLLKTSPANSQLMQMFTYQTASSARHAKNTIVLRDPARGDIVTANYVAFAKIPALNYAKEGGTVEWVFHAGETVITIGSGAAVAV